MLNFWAAAVKMNDSGLWMQHGLAKYSFPFLMIVTTCNTLLRESDELAGSPTKTCPLPNSNLPLASAQVAQAMLAQGGRVNVEVGGLVMDL